MIRQLIEYQFCQNMITNIPFSGTISEVSSVGNWYSKGTSVMIVSSTAVLVSSREAIPKSSVEAEVDSMYGTIVLSSPYASLVVLSGETVVVSADTSERIDKIHNL